MTQINSNIAGSDNNFLDKNSPKKASDVFKIVTSYHDKRDYISPNITNNDKKIRDLKVLAKSKIKDIGDPKVNGNHKKIVAITKDIAQKVDRLEVENKIYRFRDRYKNLLQDSLLEDIQNRRDHKNLSINEDRELHNFVEKRCDQVTDYVAKSLYGDKIKKQNTDLVKKALFHGAVSVPLDVLQAFVGVTGGATAGLSMFSDIMNTEFNLGQNVLDSDKSFKTHTKDWINRQMFTLVLMPPLLTMNKLNIHNNASAVGVGVGGFGVSQGIRSFLPKLVDKYIPATDSKYKFNN